MMSPIDKLSKLTSTLSKVEENLKNERDILKRVIALNSDGYWDWNLRNDYKYLSTRILKNLGYTKIDVENKVIKWSDIYHIDTINDLYEEIAALKDDDSFAYRCKVIHKDGSTIPVICKGTIVERTKGGNPIRVVGSYSILQE